MMTKSCTYDQAKFVNKFEKIAQLIQESKADSDSSIIKELTAWHQNFSPNLTQEAIKELATLLIKNYLKPSADQASLFIKISLPEIFEKQELEDQLEQGAFSAEEKADFQIQYLKNTLKTAQQYPLTNFFTPGNHADLQKILLSDLSSQELIQLSTTSKLTQKIITGILFSRDDEIALKFQTRTLQKWLRQLRAGESINDLFSSEEKQHWIALIPNVLKQPETAKSDKIQYSLLLQYLRDNDSEKINNCLVKTTTKVKAVAVAHELERDIFLDILGPATRFESTEIDALLEEIAADQKYLPGNYRRLGLMVADFNEEQLNSAILLCFAKTSIKPFAPESRCVKDALIALMKRAASLPQDTQDLFVYAVENDTFMADYAFLALFQLAQNNNPEIFVQLTEIISARSNRNQVQTYEWLRQLAPHLKQIDDHLISTLIEGVSSKTGFGVPDASFALSAIARQLTTQQLAKYSHQCLPLLRAETKDDLIRGCKIISALAASFSPCPYEIIQRLIDLEKHVSADISKAAKDALYELQPNILLLQSGVLEEELTNSRDCVAAYKYIIKLAPLLSNQDITDTFIHKLVRSETAMNFSLKMKTLAAVAKKLDDQQLDYYLAACKLFLTPLDLIDYLQAIPSSRLVGKLDTLFASLSKQLKDLSAETRSQTCKSIPMYKTLIPQLPDSLLTEVIKRLKDDNALVRNEVYQALPKMLDSLKKEELVDIFNQLVSHLSGLVGTDIEKTGKKICVCLCLLAPRLSQQDLAQAKEQLIRCLKHENERRVMAFNVLTKLAHCLDGEESTSLVSTLMANCDAYTYEYIQNIVELLTKDSLATVLELSFAKLESDNHLIRAEACSTLTKIARHTEQSEALLRKIIASLINILASQASDLDPQFIQDWDFQSPDIVIGSCITAALNGLIKLVDLITPEEFASIQNVAATSFDMIANQCALETLYELNCVKATTQPRLF